MDDIEYVSFFIPKFLWEGEEALSRDECLVLSAITSLDNDEKGCFASDEYLSRYCRCSERTISRVISSLKKKGYVKVEKPQSPHRRIHSIITGLPSSPDRRSKNATEAKLVRHTGEVHSATQAAYYYTMNIKETSSTPQTPRGGQNQRDDEHSTVAQAVQRDTIIAIAEYFNDQGDNLTQCEVLDRQVADLIAERVAEHGEDTVKNVILKANKNIRLNGVDVDNPKTIRASLQWLMSTKNFNDILRGKYSRFQQVVDGRAPNWDFNSTLGIFRKQIEIRI